MMHAVLLVVVVVMCSYFKVFSIIASRIDLKITFTVVSCVVEAW